MQSAQASERRGSTSNKTFTQPVSVRCQERSVPDPCGTMVEAHRHIQTLPRRLFTHSNNFETQIPDLSIGDEVKDHCSPPRPGDSQHQTPVVKSCDTRQEKSPPSCSESTSLDLPVYAYRNGPDSGIQCCPEVKEFGEISRSQTHVIDDKGDLDPQRSVVDNEEYSSMKSQTLATVIDDRSERSVAMKPDRWVSPSSLRIGFVGAPSPNKYRPGTGR